MGLLKPIHSSPILRGIGSFLTRSGAIPQEVQIRTIVEEVMTEQRETGQTGIGPAYYNTKDLSAAQIRTIQTQAKNLWIKHPIAKKAIKLRRSLVCGEGFKAQSKTGNKKVDEFLAFHEEINWREKQTEDRVESASVYGELAFWIPPVNTVNGHYELGCIERDMIEQVLGSPLNAERTEKIRLSHEIMTYVNGNKIGRRDFDVYRYCWLRRRWVGEALYLGLNTLSDMHRGMSDLTAVIDWLKLFDQTMWSEGERLKYLRAFLYHLKIDKATPEKIKAETDKKRRNPPGPASWIVSNESETIEPISPNINNGPTLEYTKYLFGFIAGALDMPEHWYYSANTVSKASATEMKDPIYAATRDRKREFANFRAAEAQIAVQKAALIPGSLVYGLSRADLEIEVISRNPEREAFDVIGQHLETFSRSLLAAEAQEWITKQTAAEQFTSAASIMGLGEIKPAAVSEMTAEAFDKLERRRPLLEGHFPLALKGDKDWTVSGTPVAV